MPLSEEEQKLLEAIERQFYEADPDFVNKVRTTTVSSDASRGLGLAAVGLIVSFLVLVLGFTHHWLIGLAGFAGMVACALVIERAVRRIGRASWWSFTARLTNGPSRSGEPGISQRLSDRLSKRKRPQ